MKIKFETKELQHHLEQLRAVVDKNDTTPFYRFIRLFTVGDDFGGELHVFLQAISTTATLTVRLKKAAATEQVNVLLLFSLLDDIISGISAAELLIETQDNKAAVKAKNFVGTMMTRPLGEWPDPIEWPEIATAKVGLPGLKAQIERIKWVVADEKQEKYTLARFESDGTKLRLVGCSGFQLVISDVPQSIGVFEANINTVALDLIKKLDGADAEFFISDNNFHFKTSDEEALTVNRTHGNFVDYLRIIPEPEKVKTAVTVKAAELLEALKRIRPLANPKTPVVSFVVSENGASLVFQAKHEEIEGGLFNLGVDDIEAKVDGAGITFAVNIDTILPFVERTAGAFTFRLKDTPNVVDMQEGVGEYRSIVSVSKAE